MSDIETDLPKVKKPSVKTKAPKTEEKAKSSKKVAKPAKEEKASKSTKTAKQVKPDAKKPSKKDAKPVKTAKNEKVAKASTKNAKAATPNTKGGKKAMTLTVDSVAAKISGLLSGGKIDPVAKVDYSSGKSVAEGLVVKAATILLRAYSDKNLSSITHGDAAVAKAAKAVLTKNAAAIRAEAAAKHVKKMAGQIIKAAKSADAGKLSASDYRAVAFEV